jgi:hypothetical protein
MIATRAMTGFVVVKSPRWDGRGLQGSRSASSTHGNPACDP